eukprot:2025552-Amphidinium_carterae.1
MQQRTYDGNKSRCGRTSMINKLEPHELPSLHRKSYWRVSHSVELQTNKYVLTLSKCPSEFPPIALRQH